MNRLVSILGAFRLAACNNMASEQNVMRNDTDQGQANANAVLPDDWADAR